MRPPAFYFRRPGLTSFVLLPFAMLYGAGASLLMRRQGTRAAVPVICIGNLTLGGAGKTPTAIAVASILAAMGERPAFVSRGYGGRVRGPQLVSPSDRAAEVGDEPLLLARVFATVVARNRVAGAALALEQGASVVVLDDGFQNPSLEKDLSLVVVDAASGIGNGDVFPAGPLRAPLHAQLARATGIIRVGRGDAADFVVGQAQAAGLPVLNASLEPDPIAARELAGKRVYAFAGIGHPEKFFATLRATGADIVEARAFSDHHRYSAADARKVVKAARKGNLMLVTTEKDHVRLRGEAALAELSAAARTLPVRLMFANESALRALIENALKKAFSSSRPSATAREPGPPPADSA
jgi:tetraacyldisaccharide 4'-kinase